VFCNKNSHPAIARVTHLLARLSKDARLLVKYHNAAGLTRGVHPHPVHDIEDFGPEDRKEEGMDDLPGFEERQYTASCQLIMAPIFRSDTAVSKGHTGLHIVT
jgi:hypothetical protein